MTAPIPQPQPMSEPMIEFPRWWIEQIRDGLQGPLPSGRLGDWAFTFRDQLTDALESKPPHASLKARIEELEAQLAKSCDETRFADSDAGCSRAFKADQRIEELEAALRESQKVLNMLIDPASIKSTTSIYAFAQATEVEAKIRAVLQPKGAA